MNNKGCRRVWRKGNLPTLLVGMLIGAVTIKSSVDVHQKTKNRTNMWSKNPTLGHACMHAKSFQLCLTLCDPLDCSPLGSSLHEFFRQECWSGLSCPSPEDLPNPGIEPMSPVAPALQVDSLPLSCKTEPNNAICNYMDGPGDDYTKWSKSERQISHGVACMWNLKYDTNEHIYEQKQTHRHKEQACSCQGVEREGFGV